MARNAGATREEVEAILGKYRQSGLTRQEYCKREGLTVYMLDYYQRRLYKLRERAAATAKKNQALAATSRKVDEPRTRIARVEVVRETNAAPSPTRQGFAMTLANGRRIELSNWGFQDNDLARLIQIAEQS
jgi:hypothetical protein